MTALDGADAGLVPNAFDAVTVNVTLRPLVRPLIVRNVRASVVVAVWPLEAVTV